MENILFNNEKIKVKALTPVHIGSASEKLMMRGMDFFHVDEFVYILQQNRLFDYLQDTTYKGRNALEEYMQRLSNGETRWLQKVLEEIDVDWDELALRKYKYGTGEISGSEIRPQIRTGNGSPYLPGSSIKGAIRSVLFNYLYKNTGIKQFDPWATEKDLLGTFDKAITRFIRPFDAIFDDKNDIDICDIVLFNLKNSGGQWASTIKEQQNRSRQLTVAETIKVNAESTFTLSIASGLFALLKKEENKPGEHKIYYTSKHGSKIFDPTKDVFQHLFSIINQYTTEHIRKEIDFFEKFNQAEESEYALECLESLIERTTSQNSCVLRLGYGCGFHGITGDFRFSDHLVTIDRPDTQNMVWSMAIRGKVAARYKSRRLAVSDMATSVMGFVELSL